MKTGICRKAGASRAFSFILCIFFSKAVGLLRDMIFAASFGTSIEAAQFECASRLMSLSCDIFLCGALGNILIRECSAISKSEGEAEVLLAKSGAFAGRYCLAVLSVSLLPTLILIAFGKEMILSLAPAFTPHECADTYRILRLLACAVPLEILSFSLIGFLQFHGEFIAGALMSVLVNVCACAGLIVFSDYYGTIPYAISLCVGYIFQIVFLLWRARIAGISLSRAYDFRGSVTRVLKQLPPFAAVSATLPLISLIGTWAAGRGGSTGIAAFGYAMRLFTLSGGVFTFAVSQMIFPRLAAARSPSKAEEDCADASFRLTVVLFGVAAAIAGGAEPIVTLLFSRGSFGDSEIDAVALPLSLLATAIPVTALFDMRQKLCLAQRKAYIAAASSAVAVGGSVLCSLAIGDGAGYGAGAFPVMTAYISGVVFLILIGGRLFPRGKSVIIAVCTVFAAAAWGVAFSLSQSVPDGIFFKLIPAATGFAVYILLTASLFAAQVINEAGEKNIDKSNASDK